ncbi:glycosyltransferase N-terminal domain-containing protein [Ponticaulis sp.]|uniref:3-deoxy-D-manno-octulosonic acid transferase n=1 Tax=Ponticaulis sp. TaxID=2020902 RepID=UPI000B74A6D5|nr:glycosyltransferase N-terminal domain-containing protein [Ponticaulis sp.]MAI88907.1 3-deoxy-D-manno-octulosonic acid transferase [Ponticaulis sp.]OUY01597.1 MAG: hypothetical protein CBB65_00310 [Hyphomonadaceae bacterium TMED5]|tara:strand:- start:28330 stop:29604 length:1275 start_codon:yes stop_codon:yes gene_type:complete
MTLSLFAYRTFTSGLDPFLPFVLNKRVKSGKEDAARLQERRGYPSRKRPTGKLIWMHGASIGESQVLMLLFEALRKEQPDLNAIITTQTRTSTELIERRNLDGLIHQMAAIDTPFSTERFLKHWAPDVAIFAESDVWPNMVAKLDKKRIPRMLINARMTEKSFEGWERFPKLAKKVFGGFDPILAANMRTADGLKYLTGNRVKMPGNIKYAAPELPVDTAELSKLQVVLGKRPVFAALSTHPGEEDMALKAYNKILNVLPEAVLIVAPRHPERGGDLLMTLAEHPIYHRFQDGKPAPADAVWICDTLGELGLWIRLADVVFMGGGLPGSGVLGHNPIEPLKLEKFVLSLPEVDNFKTEYADMVEADAAAIVSNSTELAEAALPWLQHEAEYKPSPTKLVSYLAGEKPLVMARDAVLRALKTRRS